MNPLVLIARAERIRAADEKRLREEAAGERPPERPGYKLYARLNHNRFGDTYVWSYRKRGRQP